jgi:hypothetical protein
VLEQDEWNVALTEVAVGVVDPVLASDSLCRDIGVAGLWVGGRLFAMDAMNTPSSSLRHADIRPDPIGRQSALFIR